MTIDAAALERLITEKIPGAIARVEDIRGDGEPHFSVHVTSPSFAGRSRVEQHRMVYAALKGHLNMDVQALSLRTSAPE